VVVVLVSGISVPAEVDETSVIGGFPTMSAAVTFDGIDFS
jgi:hypothetical protein